MTQPTVYQLQEPGVPTGTVNSQQFWETERYRGGGPPPGSGEHVCWNIPIRDGPPSQHVKCVLEKHFLEKAEAGRQSLKARLLFSIFLSGRRGGKGPPPPESLLQDGGFVALLGGSELPSLQGFRQRQEALLAGALLRWGHVHWREENSGIVKACTALRVYGCMKRTDGKWDGMEWK